MVFGTVLVLFSALLIFSTGEYWLIVIKLGIQINCQEQTAYHPFVAWSLKSQAKKAVAASLTYKDNFKL